MKKKYIIWIGIVVLIVVAVWGYSSGGGNGDDEEIFTVERQDVTEIISEVGVRVFTGKHFRVFARKASGKA